MIGDGTPTVNQVLDADELVRLCESVERVSVHDDVLSYVVSLAAASRAHPQGAVGAALRSCEELSSNDGASEYVVAATLTR